MGWVFHVARHIEDAFRACSREARLPVIPLVLKRGDVRISLHSLVSAFPTALDLTLSDLRIETLLPVDEGSERMLLRLAREEPLGVNGHAPGPARRQPTPIRRRGAAKH